MPNFTKTHVTILITSVLLSSVFGGIAGFWGGVLLPRSDYLPETVEKFLTGGENFESIEKYEKVTKVEEESAVITAAEKVSPAVVSIIVTKDLPVIERYYRNDPFGGSFFEDFFGSGFEDFFGYNQPEVRQKGTEKREVGGGTGFIVSEDGYIITNKHVVVDEEADYTVLLNDERKLEAKVLARDPINDLAIIKVEEKDLPTVELGDSSSLKVGQTVIAIGNALGEFRNTVSTGVISGLSRSIVAGGSGFGSEQLSGVIQTDASINPGNSGGPLLNIVGQVIGINTAIAQGAQNIGFTIPINEVKNMYESVKKNGRFVRPWLGVRYVQLDETIAEQNQIDIDYGALIVRGEARTDLAVMPGSPADKAGLVENDIILEIEGVKLDDKTTLAKEIAKHQPGDEITLKISHKGEEKEVEVKLDEMK